MKCQLAKMSSVYSVLVLFFHPCASPVVAQMPHYIGRTGCATATCHGGLIGDGPTWHSSASRWESSDPHRAAGEVLLTDLSQQIVAGLESRSTKDSSLFSKVLNDRCVSCHAPEAISSTIDGDPIASFRKQLSRGVGCESCHGPASVWEKLHTQLDWPDMKRFDPSVGMRETEPLLARVENCSRCHVGSRTADDSIRDMNHDMIAAGHPALAFDMYRYENALPEHWDISKSKFKLNSPTKLVSHASAARARVLSLTAKLSSERTAGAQPPQPELSEFECTACHHQLLPDSRLSNSVSSGFPSWNSWLTVGNSLNFATDKMRIDRPDLEKRIATIVTESDRRSQQLIGIEQMDPLACLRSSLEFALNDHRFRTQVTVDGVHVRAWIDQIEIAAHAASLQLSGRQRERMNQLFNSFRSETLRETPGLAISERILIRAACSTEDVGKLSATLLSTIDQGVAQ